MLIRAPIGTRGGESFDYVLDRVLTGHLAPTLNLDARAYVETVRLDSLWLDKRQRIASGVGLNHMGRFNDRGFASRMTMVFDTRNRSAFIRHGDRVIHGISGVPNMKFTDDSHYRWFEWRAGPEMRLTAQIGGAELPDFVVAENDDFLIVTRPFLALCKPGREWLPLLPVGRLIDNGAVLREPWLDLPQSLHWRDQSVSRNQSGTKERFLSLVNRAALQLGAEFSPFAVGITTTNTLGATDAEIGFGYYR